MGGSKRVFYGGNLPAHFKYCFQETPLAFMFLNVNLHPPPPHFTCSITSCSASLTCRISLHMHTCFKCMDVDTIQNHFLLSTCTQFGCTKKVLFLLSILSSQKLLVLFKLSTSGIMKHTGLTYQPSYFYSNTNGWCGV